MEHAATLGTTPFLLQRRRGGEAGSATEAGGGRVEFESQFVDRE